MLVSRPALRIKNFNCATTFCRHCNYHSRHVYAWYSMQNLFAHIQGILTTLWDKAYYGLVRAYWWFIRSYLDTKIKVYTIQTLMFGMFHATHLLHKTSSFVEVSTTCILRIFSIHQVWFFDMHFSFLFSCFVLIEIMTSVAEIVYVFVEIMHRKKQCAMTFVFAVWKSLAYSRSCFYWVHSCVLFVFISLEVIYLVITSSCVVLHICIRDYELDISSILHQGSSMGMKRLSNGFSWVVIWVIPCKCSNNWISGNALLAWVANWHSALIFNKYRR